MTTFDNTPSILTNHGYMTPEQFSVYAKDPNNNIQIYAAAIDGVLCKKTIVPNFEKKVLNTDRLVAYLLFTDSDQDGKVIYDLVTDGLNWQIPEPGDLVYRVRINNNEPEIFREEISDIEEVFVDINYIQQNKVVVLNNAPIGMVIHNYLVKKAT